MIYDVQKASLLKRFSAFLLDFILLGILTTGFVFLMSWITQINKYTDTIEGYYEQYGERYGVDFNISAEDYAKLTDDEKALYDEAYSAIFAEHPDAIKAYNMTIALPMVIITISLLLSYIIIEFVIPLCLKNGQTVGKKVFSIGVVFKNSVKITPFALFVRAIFGKYTIETMFPVMLVMLVFYFQMNFYLAMGLILALIILQIVLFFATKTYSFIHDTLSNTVVVDMQSQMIFATTQELISYQEEMSKIEAEKKEY